MKNFCKLKSNDNFSQNLKIKKTKIIGGYFLDALDEAMQALRLLAQTEGIIPAIETAHALAGTLKLGKELAPGSSVLINLSGRGDKDMETAAKYFGFIG